MNIGDLKAAIAGLPSETPVVIQVRREVHMSNGESYTASEYCETEGTDFDPDTGELYIMSEVDI